jgi:hypothetical protein
MLVTLGLAAWRCSPRCGALVSIACGVSGVCRELPETVPAAGSNCKSRDYRRSRSGRILLSCGIGNPSTRHLPRCLLLRTKGHRQKLGSAKFQTTSPLQRAAIPNVSFARVFSTTSPPVFLNKHRNGKTNPDSLAATRRDGSARLCFAT